MFRLCRSGVLFWLIALPPANAVASAARPDRGLARTTPAAEAVCVDPARARVRAVMRNLPPPPGPKLAAGNRRCA